VPSDSNGTLPSQCQLVDELNERLRLLPPADEVDVNRDQDEQTRADAILPPATFTPGEKKHIAVFPDSFLGDLKDSVNAVATGTDEKCMQWGDDTVG